MKIRELQKKVDRWIADYGVRYFDERTNTLVLVEEVGEFARLIARKYGEQSFKSADQENTVDDQIREELADILFVLTCLANQMDIDLETAITQSLEKKTIRDSERHIKNTKLKGGSK